jgi:hypothetical protein
VFTELDPLFGEADNRWQKGIDAWTATQEDSRYKPPKEYCEASDEIGISFEEPKNQTQMPNAFEIKLKVATSGEIDRIEVFANDEKKHTLNDKPYRVNINLDEGIYTLKAKAYRKDGKTGETTVKIGVNKPWDWQEPEPTPSPTPTPESTATPQPTTSPSPSPEPAEED